MKLSSKSRYGLKACFALASSGEVMSLSKLAEIADTTEKYLEQILLLLRRDGVLGTQRGTLGGYFLADKPENISVGRVLNALSDGPELVDCINSCCDHAGKCPTKSVWHKLYKSINDCLDGISLRDMVEEYNTEI